ncbi:MAG TPA: hypothetical protein PLP95_12440, partial [Microthrixaceae bacterium]|nr:hypothetical protein [Microthrixaceae bacterium]
SLTLDVKHAEAEKIFDAHFTASTDNGYPVTTSNHPELTSTGPAKYSVLPGTLSSWAPIHPAAGGPADFLTSWCCLSLRR